MVFVFFLKCSMNLELLKKTETKHKEALDSRVNASALTPHPNSGSFKLCSS